MTAPLVFEGVAAGYRGRPVLRDISLSFAAGAVTGLVGPNGAGKTTLFRIALRLLTPQIGTVRLQDKELASWSATALARTIAYLPQEAEAHWPVQARKLVALGRLPHCAAFASLSGADEAAIDDAPSRCDAQEFEGRRMDEPAAHLDPAHQLRLMELLRTEASRGTAVIVTLHDLSLASRFCDKVVVMNDGQVVADGAANEVLDDTVLRSVFAISARRLENGIVPWQRV